MVWATISYVSRYDLTCESAPGGEDFSDVYVFAAHGFRNIKIISITYDLKYQAMKCNV